jgi:hypothetical protein
VILWWESAQRFLPWVISFKALTSTQHAIGNDHWKHTVKPKQFNIQGTDLKELVGTAIRCWQQHSANLRAQHVLNSPHMTVSWQQLHQSFGVRFRSTLLGAGKELQFPDFWQQSPSSQRILQTPDSKEQQQQSHT